MKLYLSLLLFCIISARAFSQEARYEYFIVGNTNLYLPGSSSNKGIYPILWYDKTTQPKVLIGGFGVGVSVFRSMGENLSLKAQGNFSKHTYWDEPLELRGVNNEPLGDFKFGSSDFALGINTTIHYFFSGKMSIGAGLGAQLFTLTLSRLPEFENAAIVSDAISINHYYKLFLPVVPIEWSVKGKKLLFNIRYEYGLSNRYKRDLAKYKTDRFSLLYFELGFRIR